MGAAMEFLRSGGARGERSMPRGCKTCAYCLLRHKNVRWVDVPANLSGRQLRDLKISADHPQICHAKYQSLGLAELAAAGTTAAKKMSSPRQDTPSTAAKRRC